jgi:signal transduction histidine kinase
MDRYTISTIKLSISILAMMFFTTIWHTLTQNVIFDVIVNIREAITTGDSGQLFITMITSCLLFMVPSVVFYLSLDTVYSELFGYFKQHHIRRNVFITVAYAGLIGITQMYDYYPIEVTTSFLGLCITLILVHFSTCKPQSLMPKTFIALQVFLFVQWTNIIQTFATVSVGENDVFVSLKIASSYLDNLSNINKIALSFMLPLAISSFVTALIIKLYNQNLKVAEENFQHELAVKAMQKNMMKNRTYQEINALTHDLKTPLVTIQGLASLLSLTKDPDKIDSYGEKIDEATSNMSDMISSFLYGNMKETIAVPTLVEYIRAQLPVDEDDIIFDVEIEEDVPALMINKVRMARAVSNVVENAILAPKTQSEKHITLWSGIVGEQVAISVSDDGIGIPEEDLEHIWTIGFSSKETSGLGLPFTKQTVLENNGTIEIESTYGQGTKVTMYFPVTNGNEGSDTHGSN